MTPATALLLLKTLDLLVLGLQLAPGILASFQATKGRIETMVREGRDPTPEEWAELDEAIAGLRAGLHKPLT